MKRIQIKETIKQQGKEVTLAGWAHVVRLHGKLIFLDLRDRSGIIQVVFDKKLYEEAKHIKPEWVIEITGMINERPKGMQNDKIETGKIEMFVEKLTVLNESVTPPFDITEDTRKISEEKRMKYRYLDLRSERMKNNLIKRHEVVKFIRDFMITEGFIEVETPMLTKSTPEGSRDYVVPSRNQKGKFYALPQSPQQYKQLLMASGIEKYFQIARCLRDEDPRGDRQPEHTQLDIEMSFVTEEDIMSLNEELVIKIVKELYPKKKIQEIPFPRITYKEAMEKYNSDKPDFRKDKENPDVLAFEWVIDFPFFEKDDEKWTFTHNPFSASKKEFSKDLLEKKNIAKILTTQYDLVLNGTEIGGGSIRNHKKEALESVLEILGHEKEDIEKNFGHMLEAFSLGTPPHGGIAFGLDRFIMLLQGEKSIREVIAFPKTGDGRDLLMRAPSEITKEQLKELHLKINDKES